MIETIFFVFKTYKFLNKNTTMQNSDTIVLISLLLVIFFNKFPSAIFNFTVFLGQLSIVLLSISHFPFLRIIHRQLGIISFFHFCFATTVSYRTNGL